MNKLLRVFPVLMVLAVMFSAQPLAIKLTATPTLKPTKIRTTVSTVTPTVAPTVTPFVPTATEEPAATAPFPTASPGAVTQPYPGAPLCPDSGSAHDRTQFHTLWDSLRGCHYDHEHGTNPFTPEVAAAFPGVDLRGLLGGVEIGHTNLSSPAENTSKHGGFKWQVDLDIPCEVFEGAAYCITDAVVEYHWFADSAIEMNARIHTLAALLRACDIANPADCEVIYVPQFEDFGQRVSQYQGDLMDYGAACLPPACQPNPVPAYDVNRFSYFTIDRFGTCLGCRPSLDFVVSRRINSNATWTSKGASVIGSGSTLLNGLIRSRDMRQLKDDADQTYPFTFGELCSSDGGVTYNPAGCRYTNTTTRVHELAGVIPAEWDNLAGFDTDPRLGVITGQGYVTRFGEMNGACALPGMDCHPVYIQNGKPGKFGGALPGAKVSNPTCASNPSRNLWFKNGVWLNTACPDSDPLAVPSGWIGSQN